MAINKLIYDCTGCCYKLDKASQDSHSSFHITSCSLTMTMQSLRRDKVEETKVYMVLGFAFVFMALLGVLLHLSLEDQVNSTMHQQRVGIYGASKPVKDIGSEELLFSEGHYAPTARKILTSNTTATEDYGGDEGDGGNNNNGGDEGGGGNDNSGDGPNRIGAGTGATCSKDNILVFQGPTSPLPNGIPTYTVEIQNVCLSESCSISGIHVSCGWFSSARLINPSVFRRLDYDDCLVNDGKPLNPGESLSFQYANTFKYPLSVSSVSC